MNHTWTILFKGEWLKKEEVTVDWDILLNINEPIRNTIGSEDIWIRFFTNLALKLFPGVGNEIWFLLLDHLLLKPVFEAIIVDKSHGSTALTWIEKRVLRSGMIVPTNFTMNVWVLRWIDDTTVDIYSLLFKFFIQRVIWKIMGHFFLRSMTRTTILLITLTVTSLLIVWWLTFPQILMTFRSIHYIFLCAACLTWKPCPVIFDIKFDST